MTEKATPKTRTGKYTKRMLLAISPEQKRRVEDLAKDAGISSSEMVRNLIDTYWNHKNK